MHKEWPLVTAFTLVYNTGEFVVRALASLKAANYPNLQHIIVDDASYDGKSVALVEAWINANNHKCTFIKHTENKGICASLNEVLKISEGKYTFGISDDLIKPGRIFKQVEELENMPEDYALVYGDCFLIDDNDRDLGETFYQRHKVNFDSLPSGRCFEQILTDFFLCTPSIMAKTQCYRHVGGYDESLYVEDVDIFTRILKEFKILKSDYIGTCYRVHVNSQSSLRNFKFYQSVIDVYKKNLGYSTFTDSIINKKLFEYTELYFAAGGPNAPCLFLDQIKRDFTLKAIGFYVLSQIGMKHSAITKLALRLKRK